MNVYHQRAEAAKQELPREIGFVPVCYDDQGRYWITSDGVLYSFCREVPLIKLFFDNGNGYYYTDIGNKKYYKHRLLALSFNADQEKEKLIGNCDVHHLDFDKSNNTLGNLCILNPEKHRTIHTLFNRWEQWDQNI